MELEIAPEPDSAERRAIAEALAADSQGDDDGRTAWWRCGVNENLEEASLVLARESGGGHYSIGR